MFKKGYKMTEEHKRNISKTHKSFGDSHWNKRPEVKQKISLSLKGKPLSEETKRKMSLVRQNPSLELRKKWSDCRKGNKCSFWRGGITPLRTKVRSSFEYRQWRSDVYHRDDFTCQICDRKGVEINADHIKPFSQIMNEYKISTLEEALNCQELWDLNNGRTLCVRCHRKTNTYGSKAKDKK